MNPFQAEQWQGRTLASFMWVIYPILSLTFIGITAVAIISTVTFVSSEINKTFVSADALATHLLRLDTEGYETIAAKIGLPPLPPDMQTNEGGEVDESGS